MPLRTSLLLLISCISLPAWTEPLVDRLGMSFLLIPAGEFMIGSDESHVSLLFGVERTGTLMVLDWPSGFRLGSSRRSIEMSKQH